MGIDLRERLYELTNGLDRMKSPVFTAPVARYLVPFDERSGVELERVMVNRFPFFRLDEYNDFVFQQLIMWLHADMNIEALSPKTGKRGAGRPE